MRTIEANPEMSQRQIARLLGVSVGGVNFAMKALIEKGLVKARNFKRSDNKLGYMYVLTASGLKQKSELAATFLILKLQEYELLLREIEDLKLELEDHDGAG